MRTHLVKVCPHGGFDVEGGVIQAGEGGKSHVDGNP